MGGKSKSESQQQSSSGSAQTWANPYAVQGVKEIMDVYGANKDNLAAQSAGANDLLDKFKGSLNASTNVANKGRGYTSDVLSGKYLTGNPYVDQIIQATNRDVTDNVNSQFSQAGRYGSGAYTGVLTDKLAQNENALRYSNYSDEMSRMDNAASEASKQEAQAAALAMGQQELAAKIPYMGTQELAQALSALFNGGQSTGTSTSTQSSGIGGVLGGVGGILSGAAPLSDPRLKHDAVLIDREPDGLGLYRYSYLGSDEPEYGVMADEVAELRPWALGPELAGYRTVNYEAL